MRRSTEYLKWSDCDGLKLWQTDFVLWLVGSLVSNKFLEKMCETGTEYPEWNFLVYIYAKLTLDYSWQSLVFHEVIRSQYMRRSREYFEWDIASVSMHVKKTLYYDWQNLRVILNLLLNSVLLNGKNFAKSNELTRKIQCIKIWDTYIYVNGLL